MSSHLTSPGTSALSEKHWRHLMAPAPYSPPSYPEGYSVRARPPDRKQSRNGRTWGRSPAIHFGRENTPHLNPERPDFLEGAIAAKSDFQAQDDDVLLSSQPKSGTTWLKALVVSIMDNYAARTTNNVNDAMVQYDLLTENFPHDLIPSLEIQIFNPSKASASPIPLPTVRGRPRLYQTHVPYGMLSESIKTSGCKIVYITRDPKDVLVSSWHFLDANNQSTEEPYPMEDAFESFCKGVQAFGPFHDHVLGYWRECLARPDKIIFLRYEDLKKRSKRRSE
ncbi:cytosolic sulfotransferase 15-like [Coffea arabica]|uniref:Sulfotransferase n=1 Tax=Coffea arabica TaxID=13443 RepID=A0ABM4U658_COFAR